LVVQRLVDNLWIRFYQRQEDRPNLDVLALELDGKGGENELEVTPVQEVSGAEEGGPKLSFRECPLRGCLRDGALPRSGQPVQPVDRAAAIKIYPEFDIV
jgi:hypothetical protein